MSWFGSNRQSVIWSSTSRPSSRVTTRALSPGSFQREPGSTRTSPGQYSGQFARSVMNANPFSTVTPKVCSRSTRISKRVREPRAHEHPEPAARGPHNLSVMRHAVLGAGGVGTFLGAALARAGRDVVLVMREESLGRYGGLVQVE